MAPGLGKRDTGRETEKRERDEPQGQDQAEQRREVGAIQVSLFGVEQLRTHFSPL